MARCVPAGTSGAKLDRDDARDEAPSSILLVGVSDATERPRFKEVWSYPNLHGDEVVTADS